MTTTDLKSFPLVTYTREDVVKEIALWALTRRRNEIGDHLDMTDDVLGDLLSWLKKDLSSSPEQECGNDYESDREGSD